MGAGALPPLPPRGVRGLRFPGVGPLHRRFKVLQTPEK
jgi:hypothetical protein